MSATVFKYLLTASWLTPIIAIGFYLFTADNLPPEFRSYILSQPVSSTDTIIVTGIGFMTLAGTIISYVGLYRWRSWSRHLFVYVTIINVLVAPLADSPALYTSLVDSIIALSNILAGVIIALSFFSPVIAARFYRERIAFEAKS